MGADASEELGLPLAELAPATRADVASRLPGFATAVNPIDITAALVQATGAEERVPFFPYLIICTAAYALILALPVSLAVRGANAYLEARNPAD